MGTEKLPFTKLVFWPKEHDLAEFENLVKAAKAGGATHICISGLAERTDYRGEDEDSPWCEWSIHLPSLFKHVAPPGLEDAFPKDFVKRQMAFLKKKHDIVAKHGLRAAYFANEPHWLSQRVYDKHPTWRGARCDNSLKTVGMFFSPCVDNTEVLAAYRKGVELLVKEAPLIDTFIFMTNDSGSGMCWSRQLYVNPNGGTDCRFRHMGERVVGFMKAFRAGAADAGKDAEAFISTWFPPDEVANIVAKLEPGTNIMKSHMGNIPQGTKTPDALRYLGGWASGDTNPVIGYANPLGAVAGLFAARNDTSTTKLFTMSGCEEFFAALRLVSESSGTGTERDKMTVLAKLAEELFTADVVDEVLDAWYRVAEASMLVSRGGANKASWGAVSHRWLVRPLVPFQDRLTEEEMSYWLPYVYQSKGAQPECYNDYLNSTGRSKITNWSEATTISNAIDSVVDTLDAAAALFEKARDKTADKEAKDKLHIEALRVKAQKCIYLNSRHVIQVAVLGYERDKLIEQRQGSTDPEDPPTLEGSRGLFFLYRAMRWEIDNITELIALLKESPVPLISTADDKSQEGTFVCGPDLVENLEKKIRIMLRHWRDAEDGYYRPLLGG